MDCKTARFVLEFNQPHLSELDRDEADALERHLAECPECKLAAKTERQMDERLGTAMRGVAVPKDLRERLLVGLDSERHTLYRRWAFRRVREVAAVAAVLVVACTGYAYWQASQRTVIDTELFASAEELRGTSAADVEQWFLQEYSLKTALPRNFNYAYLYDRELQDLEHRSVASLRFQRGENRAEVFVLNAKQFNLPACLAQQRAGSGGITVEIVQCPQDANTAYLIRYNSASLDWLILEGQAPIS